MRPRNATNRGRTWTIRQFAGFGNARLDISDFPTRHPYGLGLWQKHIERILAGWVNELAVPIYRGRDVTGLAQDAQDDRRAIAQRVEGAGPRSELAARSGRCG